MNCLGRGSKIVLSMIQPEPLPGSYRHAGMGIREIYAQREALYAKYADVIVASRPGEDDTAHQVEEVLRTVGMQL